ARSPSARGAIRRPGRKFPSLRAAWLHFMRARSSRAWWRSPSMAMENPATTDLPAIPAKRYFTIGEVSELCGVKPHVLRYCEQESTHHNPHRRGGTRRTSQHHGVLLIRRIRELLYEHGFTINGARNRLEEPLPSPSAPAAAAPQKTMTVPQPISPSNIRK